MPILPVIIARPERAMPADIISPTPAGAERMKAVDEVMTDQSEKGKRAARRTAHGAQQKRSDALAHHRGERSPPSTRADWWVNAITTQGLVVHARMWLKHERCKDRYWCP